MPKLNHNALSTQMVRHADPANFMPALVSIGSRAFLAGTGPAEVQPRISVKASKRRPMCIKRNSGPTGVTICRDEFLAVAQERVGETLYEKWRHPNGTKANWSAENQVV